jgi:hypothetical protein
MSTGMDIGTGSGRALSGAGMPRPTPGAPVILPPGRRRRASNGNARTPGSSGKRPWNSRTVFHVKHMAMTLGIKRAGEPKRGSAGLEQEFRDQTRDNWRSIALITSRRTTGLIKPRPLPTLSPQEMTKRKIRAPASDGRPSERLKTAPTPCRHRGSVIACVATLAGLVG